MTKQGFYKQIVTTPGYDANFESSGYGLNYVPVLSDYNRYYWQPDNSHQHGAFYGGNMTTATTATIANGDLLMIGDKGQYTTGSGVYTYQLRASSLAFDGSTTTKALTPKGTWETFLQAGSPALTGTPTAPTAAADTNTTQLATTAFVIGQASSTNPVMDGTVAIGSSLKYARADHVHPTDTTRAPLASPALTGTPTAPTAAAGTNTTQIATTAFVTAAIQSIAGPMRFKGTLGATNGTISALPTASSNNQGDVYKVVDLGNYITGQADAKNGDMYISDGSTWVYIPSGDEPIGGTVTRVRIIAGNGLSIDDDTAITTNGERTLTNTGVLAIAEGTTDGTIAVTIGNNTTDVAVHGLGQLAYANTVTFTKAQIGLDQVDNISLISWAGSTNLTTLGTITTGTWNGTVIDIGHGGTGQTSAAAAWTALGGGDSGKHPENYYAEYSHGNHVPATQTASNSVYLRNDNTWHTLVPSDIGAAALDSPVFTGTPQAPTAAAGTNTTQIATTAFVTTAIANIASEELVHVASVTIAVADWDANNTCTKTVTGVTASMVVIVAPAAGSYGASTTAGVYCTDQGTNTLSFACLFSKPSAAITMNVAMIG